MTDIVPFFDGEEEKLLNQTEALHKALTHLRYEGKLFKRQNIKAVQILAYGLDLVIDRHRHLQEEVLFPFLKTHIPRHEVAITLMQTEHEEIKNHKEKLKEQILKISQVPDHLQEGKIYETGIYLVTLLRHHIGFEKRNIDHSLRKELREDEREVVGKRIEDWLRSGNHNCIGG